MSVEEARREKEQWDGVQARADCKGKQPAFQLLIHVNGVVEHTEPREEDCTSPESYEGRHGLNSVHNSDLMAVFPTPLAKVHLVSVSDYRKGHQALGPGVLFGKRDSLELLTGPEYTGLLYLLSIVNVSVPAWADLDAPSDGHKSEEKYKDYKPETLSE